MGGEIWFGKKEAGSQISIGGEGGNELLLGTGVPDWVDIPQELGGGRVRVLGHFTASCLLDASHTATHIQLPGEIQVAECAVCRQFLWYKHRKT